MRQAFESIYQTHSFYMDYVIGSMWLIFGLIKKIFSHACMCVCPLGCHFFPPCCFVNHQLHYYTIVFGWTSFIHMQSKANVNLTALLPARLLFTKLSVAVSVRFNSSSSFRVRVSAGQCSAIRDQGCVCECAWRYRKHEWLPATCCYCCCCCYC